MSWDTREHGTHVRYVQGPNEYDARGIGCRCEPCRQSNRDYEKERSQRTEPAYVAAGPARAHLAWLSTHNIGLKTISKISGLSHGGLSKLVHGDYGRGMPPSRRIRPATAERILALRPSDFAHTQTREPAAPILDMVDRLVAAGVPKVRIAERIGQRSALQLAVRGNQVSRKHATVIRAMVAELDNGTLVTVKRSRHGERTIAPPPKAPVERTRAEHDEIDALVLTLAEILERRIDENDWRKDAACRGRPTWLFFPARGDHATLDKAKRICAACIVRPQCLDANLTQKDGIFGGTSDRARRELRRATPVEPLPETKAS